jgi:NlpC/P60 family
VRNRALLIAGLLLAALICCGAPTPAQATTLGGWSRNQQKMVVNAGVMPTFSDNRFHGERRLTVAQLHHALSALADRLEVDRVSLGASKGTVSVATFDALLVKQLGLMSVANHVQREARSSGLHPPGRFGTEVVARQLGLRHSFSAADDRFELFPTDAITRAEAAWSLGVVLHFRGDVEYVHDQLMRFSLPRYSAAQKRVLRIAVGKIGMPYIWGGESDGTYSSLGGWQAHGGYDCSGYVWRVFKFSGLPWGRLIQGRTAAQQADEIPRSRRIRLAHVKGGDLLFFGTASFSSTPTEANVVHEGIALTPKWMIQSSGQGVYLGSLTEKWRRDEFAWGRRVL